MPKYGYHLGLAKLIAEKADREFTDEMKIGTLVLDALNNAAGLRRFSHFCGGAGCVLPNLEELGSVLYLQIWDSGLQKSFFVDPEIDIMLAKYSTAHIPESDYKDGLIVHLLVDKAFDELIQKKLFDFSKQEKRIVSQRGTGLVMDGQLLKKELRASYPTLDQYAMRLAGITSQDVEESKKIINATLTPRYADLICKDLNYDETFEWKDTAFFTKELIDAHLEDVIFSSAMHIITPHN